MGNYWTMWTLDCGYDKTGPVDDMMNRDPELRDKVKSINDTDKSKLKNIKGAVDIISAALNICDLDGARTHDLRRDRAAL